MIISRLDLGFHNSDNGIMAQRFCEECNLMCSCQGYGYGGQGSADPVASLLSMIKARSGIFLSISSE